MSGRRSESHSTRSCACTSSAAACITDLYSGCPVAWQISALLRELPRSWVLALVGECPAVIRSAPLLLYSLRLMTDLHSLGFDKYRWESIAVAAATVYSSLQQPLPAFPAGDDYLHGEMWFALATAKWLDHYEVELKKQKEKKKKKTGGRDHEKLRLELESLRDKLTELGKQLKVIKEPEEWPPEMPCSQEIKALLIEWCDPPPVIKVSLPQTRP